MIVYCVLFGVFLWLFVLCALVCVCAFVCDCVLARSCVYAFVRVCFVFGR